MLYVPVNSNGLVLDQIIHVAMHPTINLIDYVMYPYKQKIKYFTFTLHNCLHLLHDFMEMLTCNGVWFCLFDRFLV